MLLPGTRALIFNNLVVLSRASWIYDGFYVGCCDDFPTNFAGLNARLCQRIRQVSNRRVGNLLVLVHWSLAAPVMVNQELASKRMSLSLYKSEDKIFGGYSRSNISEF